MENRRGILLMILAMAGLAGEDALIKAASAELPVGQILAAIGLGGALAFGLVATLRGEALVSRELLSPSILVRNGCEMVATASFISALALIPLSTASAILQGVPLVVTMGAALVLGEEVGWRRWLAVTAGLLGVILIVRPGMEGFEPASLLAVLALVALAFRDLATRRVPMRVSVAQLSTWGFGSLVPTGAALLLLPGQDAAWPSAEGALTVLAALLFGLVGYSAITSAMRVGEVSVVAPFRYTRLVFALLIAAAFFDERPDALTLTGAAVVIASGLYTLWREGRRHTPSLRPSLTQTEPVP